LGGAFWSPSTGTTVKQLLECPDLGSVLALIVVIPNLRTGGHCVAMIASGWMAARHWCGQAAQYEAFGRDKFPCSGGISAGEGESGGSR